MSPLLDGETIIDVLWRQAAERPDAVAFRFLAADDDAEDILYGALAAKALRIARGLQARGLAGKAIVVALPAGLGFVEALFGALAAGCTVAPMPVSRSPRATQRFEALIDAARPAAIISGEAFRRSAARDLTGTEVLTLSDLDGDDEFALPTLSPDSVAVLQFTSGSSALPKGVEVRHSSLAANAAVLCATLDATAKDVCVSWLPHHHDMGLVGGIFAPLLVGATAVLMSPTRFLQNPLSWLRAISDQQATVSLSPNFGYQLCLDRLQGGRLDGLDLTSWRIALCGSEPVRAETLAAFEACFAPFGFRGDAFLPAYGMAEATLLISAGPAGRRPTVLEVDRGELEGGRVAVKAIDTGRTRRLVGVGRPHTDQTLAIVDPSRERRCPDGDVGEIWISGPHVATAYRSPDGSMATQSAVLLDTPGPAFFRTGDLGFLLDGELFITGRLKDLIIVNGANHHPEDLEATAVAAHPLLGKHRGAATPTSADGAEGALLIQEVATSAAGELDAIGRAVRAAISEAHGLPLVGLHFVAPGSIPRTTSGKVRRREAAAALARGELPVVQSTMDQLAVLFARMQAGPTRPLSPTEQVISDVLCAVMRVEAVNPDASAFELGLGLDSIAAAEAVFQIGRRLSVVVPLAALFEHNSVAALAAYLDAQRSEATFEAAAVRADMADDDPLAVFPLTEIQEAYLVGRDPGLPLGGGAAHAYRELAVRDLNLPRLERAVNRLITRHDMLRTVVRPEGQQLLAQCPAYRIRTRDLSQLDAAGQEEALDGVRRELSHVVRPAGHWPMFDLQVSWLGPGHGQLHVSLDLLICDVWSAKILVEELGEAYRHPEASLPALDVNFRTHVLALKAHRSGPARARALAYWRDRIDDIPAGPVLPARRGGAGVGVPRFSRLEGRLEPEAWSRLKASARRLGVTTNGLLIGLFCLVLAHWSETRRFALALTVSNRLPIHPDIQRIVGEFTSTILLAFQFDAAATLGETARRVQAQLWSDLDNIAVGGVEVARIMAQARGAAAAGAPVVFTSTLVESGRGADTPPFGGLGVITHAISQTPQVSLDHQVMEEAGALVFSWDYVAESFPDGVIPDMFECYAGLIAAVAADDEALAAPFSLPLPKRAAAAQARANATTAPRPAGALHDRFDEWAQRKPERPAVVQGDETLTYGHLRDRARALAADLMCDGVGSGDVVGVLGNTCPSRIVAVLGVLYAGAAYLPLSSTWPDERIAQIIADAGVTTVVRAGTAKSDLDLGTAIRVLDAEAAREAPAAALPPGDGERLAYVIYTSGSTGRPKGVMIRHGMALNTLTDVEARFGLDADDRVFGVSALSFDLSVFDIFSTLSCGARLVLPPAGAERDPAAWLAAVHDQAVTVWNSAPPVMDMLAEHAVARQMDLQSLRIVMLSGDWIPLTLPPRISQLAPQAMVVSLGGATEASVWSNYHVIRGIDPDWASIPYGRPLRNQTLHVLDEDLAPRPTWVAGDLYIGGTGVAAGYLGAPELTAERFITHPVSGARLYRTGDLARYMDEGVIEFLGRADGQVKVDGHRIETGEVEHALLQHPDVTGAVVLAQGEPRGRKRLVAVVVATCDDAKLRRHLAERLPSSMTPSVIQHVADLPLSENGKVDRTALAARIAPTPPGPGSAARPGGGELAQVTRRIVEEVIGTSLAPNENLLKAGATSIDIIRIGNALVREVGACPSMDVVFESPTIEAIADACARELGTAQGVTEGAVLASDEARDGAKQSWRAARLARALEARPLARSQDSTLAARVSAAGSTRWFDDGPMSQGVLSAWLESLAEFRKAGREQFLYGSAGGLYPVSTYLHVKSDGVSGVPAGFYRYDPIAHGLQLIDPDPVCDAYVLPSNAGLQARAPVVGFLIGETAAVEPHYGSEAARFCHLEAGAMAQVLMDSGPPLGVGACHMGVILMPPIRARLRLSATSILCACLAAGLKGETPAEAEIQPDDTLAFEIGEI
jgi:amino acid adenylation domain-containing protein